MRECPEITDGLVDECIEELPQGATDSQTSGAGAEFSAGAVCETAGVLQIEEESSADELFRVASALADASIGLSELQTCAVRKAAVDHLRKAKVRGGAKIIDAALEKTQEQSSTRPTYAFQETVAPWDSPVDGNKLVGDLCEFFRKVAKMPEACVLAVALWVLNTYSYSVQRTAPRLCITSAVKRCGKTTLLSALGKVGQRPLLCSNASTAAVFRAIEKWHVTLLIDEADTFLKEREELRGVINSGHSADTAFVLRSEGDDHEPHPFSTWAPIAISMIGKPHETLVDRSIVVRMERMLPGERVKRLRDLQDEASTLKRKCTRWAEEHLESIKAYGEPDYPDGLNHRAADNWEPLAILAELAGGPWPEAARRAALALSGEKDDGGDSVEILLLTDLREILGARKEAPTKEILPRLHELEDRPWNEWGRQKKPLSASGLAGLLRKFEIRPGKRHPGTRVYRAADFQPVFERYLPCLPATGATTISDNDLGQALPAMGTSGVAGAEDHKSLQDNAVAGVASGPPHEVASVEPDSQPDRPRPAEVTRCRTKQPAPARPVESPAGGRDSPSHPTVSSAQGIAARVAAELNATEVTDPSTLAAADEMRLEVEGKRPPPNASVHRMLDGARSRSGVRFRDGMNASERRH